MLTILLANLTHSDVIMCASCNFANVMCTEAGRAKKEEEMRERAGVYDSDTSDDEEAVATRKIADKYAK